MSTRTFGDDRLPSVESPLDAVDMLLTAGGALGILTYAGGLLVGDVETATLGVGFGVACVLGTLAFQGVRDAARALG